MSARPGSALGHANLELSGVRLHAVSAGSGEPVLLVPGWPQSWYAWRRVIPALADAGRRAHAVDPRGFGDSDKPAEGYDLDTLAGDLRELIERLNGGGPIDVVAHDLGTWIAHALAVERPDLFRTLTLVDSAIPGVTPAPTGIPDPVTNRRSWHFGFNRLQDLPEMLLRGRERLFLEWLFASKSVQSDAFEDAALDEYARVLAAPGAIWSGLQYYREAFSEPGLLRAEERRRKPLTMPVLTVGGTHGAGSLLHDALVDIAPDLTGLVIEDCGHYVPEECPRQLVEALLGFWRQR